MSFKENTNKNYARVGTIVFHALLLLWFAFYGLTYQNPPPEEGIAINFGYEEDGAGNTSQATPVTTPPPAPAEPVETPQAQEEVVTQDIEEAPVINDPAEVTSTNTPTEPVQNPKETVQEPTTPEPNPVPELTPEEIERQKKQEELNRRFNTQNQGQGQGEGETDGGGDQGDPSGDILSPNRTGNKGAGNSGDYNLAGRTVRNKPKPNNDCNKEGVVVVRIRVDANGKVVQATGGVNIPNGPKSNYGTSSCLLPLAESAAKKTTWTPKAGADLQVGYIVYRFELQ